MEKLTLSQANGKLEKMAREMDMVILHVRSFDLPAGWTCPAADKCMMKFNPCTKVMHKGKNNLYDCYAAKAERQYDKTRIMRWRNFNMLKNCNSTEEIVELIEKSLTYKLEILRIHSSGDFFSKAYFLAWVEIAKRHPEIEIYGYTKVLQYVNYPKPDNFNLIYSMGGKLDKHYTNEPACHVVQTHDEAYTRGLYVACDKIEDDYTNIRQGLSFALIEH